MSNKNPNANTSNPVNSMMSAMADLQKAGFGPMSGLGTDVIENMNKMGSEVVQFVADRIREDVKTQSEIFKCKDMEELKKIQTDYLQRTIDQYSAETGKLVSMSKDMMATTLKKKPE